jgi:diguanylate cyclase (GGDEF)-like protein/PAS domain S-box-containing protein
MALTHTADPPPAPSLLAGHFGRLLVAGLAYYLAARLGLLFPYVGTHVSLVWLPTGIAVAALLRWGPAMAPAVFAAATAANAAIGVPLWVAAAIAAGNTLGPWLAVRLLQRWGFDAQLTRRRDLAAYLVAALLGMSITASNGCWWLYVGGLLPAPQAPAAWMTWWIGDAVGALLGGVPLVGMNASGLRRTFGGGPGLVNAALQLGVLACGFAAFSPWFGIGSAWLFPLVSLPFFLITLLALRGGALNSSLAVLLLSIMAAFGTARGLGPFAGHDLQGDVLALWSYITAQACTSLMVCGVASELHSSRSRLTALVRHAQDAIVMIGPDETVLAINPAAAAMLGLQHVQMAGQPLASLPHGNGLMLSRWLQHGPAVATSDLQVLMDGGRSIPVECQSARYRDAGGHWQTHVTLRDLTMRKQADARLAASEQRLQAITDNLPALISYIDKDHRVLFANKAFETWLGRDRRCVIGQQASEALGAFGFEAHRPQFMQALASVQNVTFEHSLKGSQSPDLLTSVEPTRVLRTTFVPDAAADSTVRGVYALSMDVTEMKAVETQLMKLARLDHLTGLPNRRQFERRLDSALTRARSGPQSLGVMFIDVDHFKDINDSLGHAAGDAVLKEFGRRLAACVRSSDLVARLAGDEFVVVLEQLRQAEEAQLVAGKIIAALEEPMLFEDRIIAVSASIGIGLADTPAEASPAALMATADRALYAAKRGGRKTFRLAQCGATGDVLEHVGGRVMR